MADEGKKVGVIGGIIAALGGAFAHGADDCARVGARGASEVAGVRAVGNVGDDLARAGVKAVPRAAPRVPGLVPGRVPGAVVLPGAADDLGRAGARAAGFKGEVGFAAVGEEVAAGSKPWKDLAEELGQELSTNVLAEILEPGADESPSVAPPARGSTSLLPTRIALVPALA